MAHTNPSSTITLYEMPVDTTYRNVMDFSSDSQLQSYLGQYNPYTPVFPGGETNYSYYIRRNSTVDIPLIFDACEKYTYCKYNNGEGEGNEYAFIIDKQFINMGTTRIKLMYDVWTNFLVKTHFDPFHDSGTTPSRLSGLIQRAHSNDDTQVNIMNDIPVIPSIKSNLYSYNSMETVILVTYDSDTISARSGGSEISERYKSIAFGERTGAILAYVTLTFDDLMDMVVNASKYEGIYAMYAMNIPSSILTKIKNRTGAFTTTLYENSLSNVPIIYGINVDCTWNNVFSYTSFMNDDLEVSIGLNSDYVDPKILSSPYSMVELILGETTTSYAICELSDYDKFAFNYDLRFSASGIVARIRPSLKYSHSQVLYMNSIPLTKVNDAGRMMILRSGISAIQTSLGMSGMGSKAFAISANEFANDDNAGRTISSLDAIKNSSSYSTGISASPVDFLGNCFLAHMTPDTINMGVNNGISAMLCGGAGNIVLRTYKCRSDIQENLERYWGRYGYPFNKYDDQINIRRRTRYDYFKLLDCQISTSVICQSEVVILRRIFEQGVGIYHYGTGQTSCPFGNVYTSFVNPIRT